MMSSTSSARYSFGFMAVSLRPDLARLIAECYLDAGDWEQARHRALTTNALQYQHARTGRRIEMELRQRLQTLTPVQLQVLAQATAEDRAAMAWLATIKRVQFIFEFAAEALRDKIAVNDPVLRHSDYEAYVENKGVAHPELTRLAPSSRDKVRQIIMQMLGEAGMLVAGTALGMIQRPVLSPVVVSAVTADDPRWLAGFLIPDREIARL